MNELRSVSYEINDDVKKTNDGYKMRQISKDILDILFFMKNLKSKGTKKEIWVIKLNSFLRHN